MTEKFGITIIDDFTKGLQPVSVLEREIASQANENVYYFPFKGTHPTTCGFDCHKAGGRIPGHDWGMANGTSVTNACAGKVSYLGGSTIGYGNHVVMSHAGNWFTLYAHFKSFSCKLGDEIPAMVEIGKSDNTGNSTGPHLHFEIYQGYTRYNPMNYLQAWPSTPVGEVIADKILIPEGLNIIRGNADHWVYNKAEGKNIIKLFKLPKDYGAFVTRKFYGTDSKWHYLIASVTWVTDDGQWRLG